MNPGEATQKPVAVIQVVLLPDGNVMYQCQGQINRKTINMMMESARQLMLRECDKIEDQIASGTPPLQAAPAAFINRLNGKK